jgi:hypothetical protein
MWALYLLMDTWLSGSFLLPFMLFVRWSGTKWRRLHWLTDTRKRWLLIWGCYGFVKVTILSAVHWVLYFPGFSGSDSLFGLVWRSLNALHVQIEPLSIEFLLGPSLRAVVEAASDCGLAAIAWWVFSLLTRKEGRLRRRVGIERFGISLLLSTCALGIANSFHFSRLGTCADCNRPDGIPFTFFHGGGYGGGAGFVWRGVIGDFLVMFLLGIVLGLVWNKLAQGHPKLHATTS